MDLDSNPLTQVSERSDHQHEHAAADSAFSFTLFENADDRPLSKSFSLDESGELVSRTAAAITHGTAVTTTVSSILDFAEIIGSLGPQHAICAGVMRDNLQTAEIVTAAVAAADPRPGRIARTKDYLSWSTGPGVMVIDYDPPPGTEPLTPAQLVERINRAAPGLLDRAYYLKPSTSSNIVRTSDGVLMRGCRGLRIYIPARSAADIPRAGQALSDRLWLQGDGRIMVSKSGAALMRSLIDLAVFSPERLDFVAAHCGPGLEQDRSGSIVRDAGLVDTVVVVKSLTKTEIKKLAAIQSAAKAAAQPESESARRVYTEARVSDLIASRPGMTREDAERVVRDSLDGNLQAEFPIILEDGSVITIADILEDPERFHGQRCADPLEPEYRGDHRIAMIVSRGGARPYIRSFAHGGQKFWLHDEQSRGESDPEHPEPPEHFDHVPPEGSDTRFEYASFADLHDNPPAQREWTLREWLPRATLALMSGPGGIGKSLLGQQIATAVATGDEMFGCESTQGPVIGFFCEDSNEELRRRELSIINGKGWQPSVLRDLHLQGRQGLENTLANFGPDRILVMTGLLRHIESECERIRPVLVILDNVAQMFGGIENDRHQVTVFCNRLTAIAMKFNCSVLLLGHVAKAEGSEYSGSTAWEAAVRTRLWMRRDGGTGRVIFHRAKANYSALDEVTLEYLDGRFVVYRPNSIESGMLLGSAKQTVLAAIATLHSRQINVSQAVTARTYLPRTMNGSDLLGGHPFGLIEQAMRYLIDDDALIPNVEMPWRNENRSHPTGLGTPAEAAEAEQRIRERRESLSRRTEQAASRRQAEHADAIRREEEKAARAAVRREARAAEEERRRRERVAVRAAERAARESGGIQ